MHGASLGIRTKTMTMLANKIALVTGASRGMGRATALALGAAGARVIVHYGRNADEAKAVVDRIRANGGQADAVAADLAAPDGAHVLAAEVRNLVRGKLDILVSNAGISNATTIETLSVKEFDSLFAVNVRAPYFLVQQLLPIMSDGGTIVFVSSLGARAAVGTLAAYASTKGAINTLVKYLAARPARHPRQCRRARRDRHRHVELHQDRSGPCHGDGDAVAQAHRPARRRRFRCRIPRFRCIALDHRRRHRSRRRLKTLAFAHVLVGEPASTSPEHAAKSPTPIVRLNRWSKP
jgi:NADP-dependent 3-hydroxy acid dehydrogenase YdfG